MDGIFLKLFNMSVSAGWLVLAVVLLRWLLKKAPKWLTCLLWVLVGVRLVCPFSLESVFSLLPTRELVPQELLYAETPVLQTGSDLVNAVIDPVLSQSLTPTPGASVNPLQILIFIAALVWVAGVFIMLLYATLSTWRLHRRVRESIPLTGNIRLCDGLTSPFILGVFRPRIYLPAALSEAEQGYVIAHEQAHLHRRDHWWKPLGWLLLTVYWFHPLMWVAYILLCRDIEMACDERVVATLDTAQRKAYSYSLLACRAPRRLVTACPLAFGETGVRQRVKAVLHYKKPAFWVLLVTAVACVVVAVPFLTDPPSVTVDDELRTFLTQSTIQYHHSEHSDGLKPCVSMTVFGTRRHGDNITVYGMTLYQEYANADGALVRECGSHCATAITVTKTADGYRLVEYWTPQDGAYHKSSIQEKFPWQYEYRAMDTQRYIDAHQADCDKQAKAHFGLDGKTEITNHPVFAEYVCEESEMLSPQFSLAKTSDECRYTGSVLSSFVEIGHYQLTDDILQLYLGETTLVFQREGSGFLFDRTASTGQVGPELKDGSLFLQKVEREPVTVTDAQVLAATSWVSEEKKTQLYAALPQDGEGEQFPAFVLGTQAELVSFFDTYCGAWQQDTGRTAVIQGLLTSYDEAFFTDSVLLIAAYQDASCSVSPQLVGVFYSSGGTGLQMTVDVYEPQGQDTALGEWFLIAGVSKQAVKGVTQVQATVRQHLPMDHYVCVYDRTYTEHEIPTEARRRALTYEEEQWLKRIVDEGRVIDDALIDRTTLLFDGYFYFYGDTKYFISIANQVIYYDHYLIGLADSSKDMAFIEQLIKE